MATTQAVHFAGPASFTKAAEIGASNLLARLTYLFRGHFQEGSRCLLSYITQRSNAAIFWLQLQA